MKGILDQTELLELHAAALSAGMADVRPGSLARIPSDFVASLKVTAVPSEQLLSDLSAMNTAGSLMDGSVPLETWLHNAVALAGGRRETVVFKRLLEQVQERTITEARGRALRAAAEATATVAQLRAVGASLARISLTVLARAGIVGRFPWHDKLRLRAQLTSQLLDLGVPREEIDAAEEAFRFMVRFRLGRMVTDSAKAMKASQPESVPEGPIELDARLRALFNFDRRQAPSSAELRRHVGGLLSSEVERRLRALEHFEKTGEISEPGLLDED